MALPNSSVPQNQGLQIPPDVRIFLSGLLEDAGIVPVDEIMKEEMIKELFARLDNFITTTIVDNMPEEHIDAFIKMNEEKKPKNEIEAFLKEKMPNYQTVFSQAFADFRELYLSNTTVAANAPKNESNTDIPNKTGLIN